MSEAGGALDLRRSVKPARRAKRRLHEALRILGTTKSFHDPWVGHPTLNRLGLHPARIALSDALTEVRRRIAGTYAEAACRTLCRDGVVVVQEFLPRARFEAVRGEALARVESAARTRSLESLGDRGFGPKREFRGGFDRWDGGTLNRYLFIDETIPETLAAARSLARLGGMSMGSGHRAGKVVIYQTVHGRDEDNHDIQKDLHRDTFHRAAKLWYFLTDVELEHGPFCYVEGSHRMTLARYRWEHACAMRSCNTHSAHSSFRIDETELLRLGLPKPKLMTVRANTLVLADVRGFHKRGAGKPGAQRVALYSGIRKNPFLPIPIPPVRRAPPKN